MQDLQVQCFVKRDYQPAFTSDSMPRLLYISRRLSSDQNHPRLLHAHPDFTEVLLMEEGSARFLIGETTYEVQAGDLLVVDRSLAPANGDVIIACVNGDFTVKTFRRDAQGLHLVPANPRYPTISFPPETAFGGDEEGSRELDYFGKVTAFIHRFVGK